MGWQRVRHDWGTEEQQQRRVLRRGAFSVLKPGPVSWRSLSTWFHLPVACVSEQSPCLNKGGFSHPTWSPGTGSRVLGEWGGIIFTHYMLWVLCTAAFCLKAIPFLLCVTRSHRQFYSYLLGQRQRGLDTGPLLPWEMQSSLRRTRFQPG